MLRNLLDQRWPWLLAAGALVAVGIASFVLDDRASEGDARPIGSAEQIAALRERSDLNLLFIVIDTLRADRLGAYGYERDTSPTLDRLAAEGVRFHRHMAQSSWTKCSMASLWTGLNPRRVGISRFDEMLSAEAEMPAELLQAAGYRTAGIYRNGWVAPTFGFEQGFDVYKRPAPRPRSAAVRAANPTISAEGTDEDAIAAALEFLRIHGHERWFAYLHLMDVHEYLYDEESALFGSSYSDIYDNSIRWTDRTIAILLEYLDAWGLRENTIIAITSDHGEAFRERGFEGHAREVHRESTEVPFLLSLPFRLEQGAVVETRTRGIDVWPTLLDLLGIEAPTYVDGVSLVPDMISSARNDAAPAPDRTAIAYLDQSWGQRGRPSRHAVAVAEGPLRYVRTPVGARDIEELFDASEDSAELVNLAAERSDTLERLRGIASASIESTPPWGEAPRREIGELELNQLRALGYAIP